MLSERKNERRIERETALRQEDEEICQVDREVE